jgi:hypothetical protein
MLDHRLLRLGPDGCRRERSRRVARVTREARRSALAVGLAWIVGGVLLCAYLRRGAVREGW